MANDFQGEVGFAHASDILFVHLIFMFLTYEMSVRHRFVRFVLFQEKAENMYLVVNKVRKTVKIRNQYD